MKTALWLRVSDPENQTSENQRCALETEARRRGLRVVKTYDIGVSGWKGAHDKALSQLYKDARAGRFKVVLIWALDRLDRRGPLATLEAIERLTALGVTVVSLQESWLEIGGPARDLLISILSWVARWESQRRSERTRAGLETARRNGKRLGRPPGARDKRKRKKSGYFLRWAIHT